MSCKTIVTLLLLSCLGATGTPLGVPEEPPLEGGVKAIPLLTIKAVQWLITDGSTNVQVCVDTDLPDGTPSLSYNEGIKQINVGGDRDDTDLKCATFKKDVTYTFTEEPARYELIVADTVDPTVLLGRGVSTFAITVRSTLLTCGGSLITKVTWSGSEDLSVDFQCIAGSAKFVKACYHDGDITGTDLCFGVKDANDVDVNVCLNGPIDNRPTAIGPINSNYFYYGSEAVPNVPPDATLSLTMLTADLTDMRAIVWQAEDLRSPEATRVAKVFGCSPTDCTFAKYERKLVTYEVCLEAMDASLTTLETATTTLTDLKLYAFDGDFQKSMLLDFVFANGLADMRYTASLFDKLPEVGVDLPLGTINIDCTGVLADHACFGYLDTDLVTGATVYVTVSGSDGFNTIIVPFAIP